MSTRSTQNFAHSPLVKKFDNGEICLGAYATSNFMTCYKHKKLIFVSNVKNLLISRFSVIKNAITVQNFCRVIPLLKPTMDNPFLALFENSPPPKKSDSPTPTPKAEPKPPTPTKTDLTTGASRLQHVNQIIENSFLFTINPYGLLGRKANDPVKSLLFLQVCSCQSFIRNSSKHKKSIDLQ